MDGTYLLSNRRHCHPREISTWFMPIYGSNTENGWTWNQGWASNRSKVRVKIKSSRTNELMIFWTSNFSEKVNSRTHELLQFFQGRTFELVIFSFFKWTRTRELTNFDFFSEHELSNFWSLTFFRTRTNELLILDHGVRGIFFCWIL